MKAIYDIRTIVCVKEKHFYKDFVDFCMTKNATTKIFDHELWIDCDRALKRTKDLHYQLVKADSAMHNRVIFLIDYNNATNKELRALFGHFLLKECLALRYCIVIKNDERKDSLTSNFFKNEIIFVKTKEEALNLIQKREMRK